MVDQPADIDPFVSFVDYPMYVATVAVGSDRSGCLVGFATQTSIDPARFLVCISHANATARLADRATHAAVHLLGSDQRDVAQLFGEESGDWTDKFARCSWHDGPHGVPVLDGCPAVLVGEVVSRHDLGDHLGLLLAPVDVTQHSRTAVLTFQQLRDLDPGHPA